MTTLFFLWLAYYEPATNQFVVPRWQDAYLTGGVGAATGIRLGWKL